MPSARRPRPPLARRRRAARAPDARFTRRAAVRQDRQERAGPRDEGAAARPGAGCAAEPPLHVSPPRSPPCLLSRRAARPPSMRAGESLSLLVNLTAMVAFAFTTEVVRDKNSAVQSIIRFK